MSQATARPSIPKVAIETRYGQLIVELYPEQAPHTVANFLAYVEQGLYTDSSFFRIVNADNAAQPEDDNAKIQVIQGGLPPEHPALLPPIAHETTAESGIKHLDGVISMARFAPGTADGSFFFCINDQPELDHGGKRYPDGLGFAAFGRLIRGRDVLEQIYTCAEPDEYLTQPVTILRCWQFR